MLNVKQSPRVCNYEGSPYRTVFWEDVDRRYEDATERLALRDLLGELPAPRLGARLVDLGAGFGRLVNEYDAYDEVFLVDYAESMLADARSRWGDRCTYVCADLYQLPFATASIDTAVQVRVLHHVEDMARAFGEVARSLRTGGSYVLEFANKRHLKARLRGWLPSTAAPPQAAPTTPNAVLPSGAADPDDERPHEFVPLDWNFHPAYVQRRLRAAGLTVRRSRAVSHFRVPALKERLAPELLARLDAVIGAPLAGLTLAPSQFVRASKLAGGTPSGGLWRCPACGEEPLVPDGDAAPCPSCGRVWLRRDGIWMFKE